MQPTMKQLYVMYAQKLQEVRNVNKPPLIADMLGIARKGNGTIRLTIKEWQYLLDATAISAIETIIKRGNDAEIKLVHGNIVVIEIHRKTAYKTVTTG